MEQNKLSTVAQNVQRLEERHNEVLDNMELTKERLSSLKSEMHARTAALTETLDGLHQEITIRMERARSASVLLSLIAQQEELSPLRNRIENQPYPFYVDRIAFRESLERRE